MAQWSGFRIDSKEPVEGGEEVVSWWRAMGEDPREKLLIFSDGLDIDSIERAYRHFSGRVRLGFGWGTLLTNDLRGCSPSANPGFDPISLVCKVTRANGQPTVKLSDNLEKASGPPSLIEHYKEVFGCGELERKALAV